MTFQDAVKTCFQKYADFNGRAGKGEFWWFMLFCFGTSLVLNMFSSSLGFLFSLATFVPSIASYTLIGTSSNTSRFSLRQYG